MTGTGLPVEVRGLFKTYGELKALDGVDLHAEAGELVSIIGPSGCGKSTVFNILAGLDQATAGDVLIGGHPAALGASAYMPQRDALLPWLHVIDNVALPLVLAGRSKRDARGAAEPLLDRFGLGEFAAAWPWQLSGGMRHRAAFLRTVIAEPAVMLLDEPFGALDGITRTDLQQWLAGVLAQFGSTVLLVTHDVAEAVYLSDRVYVMGPRPGRVVAEITVDLGRPRPPDVLESAAFADLERRLRHELRAAVVPG